MRVRPFKIKLEVGFSLKFYRLNAIKPEMAIVKNDTCKLISTFNNKQANVYFYFKMS